MEKKMGVGILEVPPNPYMAKRGTFKFRRTLEVPPNIRRTLEVPPNSDEL
jgi:hypothetical protein